MFNAPKTINLDHRAVFLETTASANFVLAASSEGKISTINTRTATVESVCTKPLTWITLHPEGNAFAATDEKSGKLYLRNLQGALLCEIEPPKLLPSPPGPHSLVKGFATCLFSESGSSLLASAHIACDMIAVQYYNLHPENNAFKALLVNTVEVEDPFVDSYCSFHSSGNNLFPFWIAAGQDGQQVRWFGIEGQRLTQLEMPFLENTSPPVFSQGKDLFVLLDEDRNIGVWSSVSGEQLGCCEADEYDPFESSMGFIDETHVLAATSEGRAVVIDTNTMDILHEVDPKLCMNFIYFCTTGESVVFVHRRDGGIGLEGWCDDLTFVDYKHLLNFRT